eukprot:TRINITY_DN11130_c0_g1_i1.p1 TRINITY_DN11130_c0_g1~~TRINITY_DN11130_c0_g1_i1.p1  ORF type:complete len:183 (-),score=12.06 TRINITY_DN11130_c0_g1_i1:43-591(-)
MGKTWAMGDFSFLMLGNHHLWWPYVHIRQCQNKEVRKSFPSLFADEQAAALSVYAWSGSVFEYHTKSVGPGPVTHFNDHIVNYAVSCTNGCRGGAVVGLDNAENELVAVHQGTKAFNRGLRVTHPFFVSHVVPALSLLPRARAAWTARASRPSWSSLISTRGSSRALLTFRALPQFKAHFSC